MEYRLKDVLQDKGYIRGPFGSALKRAELKNNGIPVYEQQHAIYANRDFRYYIDDEKYNELKRFTVKTNDLIISCSGTIGKIDLIKENDEKGIISQALLILRPNLEVVNPKYLYYFFKSNYGYNCIVSRSMGSVQVNIAKREFIENIKINLPSKDNQNKIVKILENIDKKIELNNQMNDNLFTLITTQYNEVLEKNEKYEVKKLKDIAIIGSGKRPKVKGNDYNIPLIGASGIMDYTDDNNFDEDIIIIGRVGTLGVVQRYFDKIWASDNTLTIKTEFKNVVENYLKNVDYIALNRGSTQPLITQTDISNLEIKYNKEKFEIFEQIVVNIREKIYKNELENRKLKQLLDILLPQLMNGEMDLDKIEI